MIEPRDHRVALRAGASKHHIAKARRTADPTTLERYLRFHRQSVAATAHTFTQNFALI